jgi:hypothetical protein
VTANPSVVTVNAGVAQLSTITVTVRSTSGSLPPNGSVVVVTISPSAAGTLDGPLCDPTVAGRYCLPVSNGTAQASFTPNTSFTGTVVVKQP